MGAIGINENGEQIEIEKTKLIEEEIQEMIKQMEDFNNNNN